MPWRGTSQDYWNDPNWAGRGRGGWEGRINDQLDTAVRAFGLHEFLPGQAMGPERVQALFAGQLGAMPMVGAPSVGGMQRYGQGAQDMAARAAALQSGQAYANMGGMNPAARAAAMAQVAQSAAGGVGQAGVQGYLQGGQMMQQVGLANLQAQMQNRMAQQAQIENALQRAAGIGQWGAGQEFSAIRGQSGLRDQQRAQNRQARWGAIGGVMGGLGSLVGLGVNPLSMLGLGGGGQQQQNPYDPFSGWYKG